MPPTGDRRAIRRFDMRLAASVKLGVNGAPEVLTETENVSARGVYFHLANRLDEGRSIEVTLSFPSHIAMADNVRVRVVARVLRSVAETNGKVGIAALIENYEFLRAEPTVTHETAASAG